MLPKDILTFFRNNLIENLLVRRVVVLSFLVIATVWLIIAGVQKNKEYWEQRKANLTYTNQLNELNKVDSSLKCLIEFINAQKARLNETEVTLAKMKEEASSLAPVLQARREEVSAVLALYESRTKGILVRERIWGIIIGVLTTLIASSIIWIIKYVLGRKIIQKPLPKEEKRISG